MSASRKCNARGKIIQSSFPLLWLLINSAGHKPHVQRAKLWVIPHSLQGAKRLMLSSFPSSSPAREGWAIKREGKTIKVKLAQAKSCLAPSVSLSPTKPLCCVGHGPGADSPLRDEWDPWHRARLPQRPPSSDPGESGPGPSPVYLYSCQSQGSFQHQSAQFIGGCEDQSSALSTARSPTELWR